MKQLELNLRYDPDLWIYRPPRSGAGVLCKLIRYENDSNACIQFLQNWGEFRKEPHYYVHPKYLIKP